MVYERNGRLMDAYVAYRRAYSCQPRDPTYRLYGGDLQIAFTPDLQKEDLPTLVLGVRADGLLYLAVRAGALRIPAAGSRSATVGFCWGGSTSFAYAAAQPGLQAAVVYYGTSPEEAKLAGIQAPVLGLYGADDARVTATIEPASAEMKRLGKRYEVEIYEGAGHGFLRAQADRAGANRRATEQAWPRMVAFLKKNLPRNSSSEQQVYQFLNAAFDTYCPEKHDLLVALAH